MSRRQGVKRPMVASLDQDASPSLNSGFTFHIDNPNWGNVSGVQLRKHGDGESTSWIIESITEEDNKSVIEHSLTSRKLQTMHSSTSRELQTMHSLKSRKLQTMHSLTSREPQTFSAIAREPQTFSAIAWSAKCAGTFLPHNDPNPEKRKITLLEQRKLYEYAQRQKGIPCQVKNVPEIHGFHYAQAEIERWLGDRAREYYVSIKGADWKNLEDVSNPFGCFFQRPNDITRWDDDFKFGMQRFAGTNNSMIRLCTEIPMRLAVTPEMLKPFLENDTLVSAIQKKRLFVIDHSILKNCPTIRGHVVCSPIALFYRQNNQRIVPIAIQLFQDKADDNPVFLPSDPKYTWILAKMWFNNADASVHQSISHLGYTHIIMEGFEVSIHRNLAKAHPMFKLLAPHFVYLMTINYLALDILLGKDQFMDTVVSVGTKGAYELIRQYRTKWRLNVEGTLPADLKERGVDSPEVVPDYPFRDDALLTYNAILKYVTDYVLLYYPSDNVLSDDYEIQNWREELDRPIENGGLGVLGVEGVNGTFTSRDQLIQVVTSIIYTCSAGHAAVNFKQYDEYAFPMNYPSKLQGKPPSDKRSLSERDVLQTIQNRSDQYQLLTIVKILSEHSYGKPLGTFEEDYICEPKAMKIVEKFRKELEQAHGTIEERNRTRTIRYDYMDPFFVPNSINI